MLAGAAGSSADRGFAFDDVPMGYRATVLMTDLDPVYLRRLLVRAFVVWVILRTTVALLSIGLRLPVRLPVVGVLLLVAVVAWLCRVDARIMRETVFFGNAGVASWMPGLVGAALALAGELLVTSLFR
jgi:hypothetical protein